MLPFVYVTEGFVIFNEGHKPRSALKLDAIRKITLMDTLLVELSDPFCVLMTAALKHMKESIYFCS